MPSYLAVAQRLLQALGEDPRCALAGGVAVAAHGFVRGTKDVDILVAIPLEEAQRRLATHEIATILKKGDFFEGDFACLKGSLDGVPFDIIPQLVPVDWERLITVSVGDATVRVVDLGSLLAMKFKAGGPLDLLDATMLTLIHPEQRASALQLAARYGMAERFERMLVDPRNRARAAEDAALASIAPAPADDSQDH